MPRVEAQLCPCSDLGVPGVWEVWTSAQSGSTLDQAQRSITTFVEHPLLVDSFLNEDERKEAETGPSKS